MFKLVANIKFDDELFIRDMEYKFKDREHEVGMVWYGGGKVYFQVWNEILEEWRIEEMNLGDYISVKIKSVSC